MHRIDGPGATIDNKFTEGNPATSVPATDVTDDWLNDVQEELMTLLTNAGITPVKGTQNQILSALRAAGVFQTAAQFDNTTKAATTEFVQRALGSIRGWQIVLGTTTLTVANVGNIVQCNNAGYNITLPAANAVPAGASIHFRGYSTGNISIIRQGADQISYGAATGFTSIPLTIGGSLTMISNGADAWMAVAGSDTLPYASGLFGASLSGNGWQRLPSGLLECRGTFTASATPGAAVAVTFPLAFTALQELVITPVNAATTTSSAWHDGATASGFNGRCNIASAVCHYIAKGTV